MVQELTYSTLILKPKQLMKLPYRRLMMSCNGLYQERTLEFNQKESFSPLVTLDQYSTILDIDVALNFGLQMGII